MVLPERRTPHSHAIGTSRQAASILCSQKGLAIMLVNYTFGMTKCKVLYRNVKIPADWTIVRLYRVFMATG
jgi:ABC-type sulfate transport system substrate-binding protein